MAARGKLNSTPETIPDISNSAERQRLSPSAMKGFFKIVELWGLSMDTAGELLGGIPSSSLYKLKSVPGTRTVDELTRISYILGIYSALHVVLPEPLANEWMTRPNSHPLFGGRTPLAYVLRTGIPGLKQVRSILDDSAAGF